MYRHSTFAPDGSSWARSDPSPHKTRHPPQLSFFLTTRARVAWRVGWFLGNRQRPLTYARISMRSTRVLWTIGLTSLFTQACGEEREFGNGRTNTTQNNDTSEETSEASETSASEVETQSSAATTEPVATVSEDPESTSEEPHTLPGPETEDTTSAAVETSAPAVVSSSAAVESSAPPMEMGPVKGRVIDFWGNPVPNLDVDIAGQHAFTNDDGVFEIDVDSETYDVSFVVEIANPHTVYGWRFEHLTRRDPTLQVYSALEPRESTMLTRFGTDLGSSEVVGLGLGSENANFSTSLSGPTYVTPDWRGPSQTLANVHGLWWSNDETTELPTTYLGYAEDSVALSDSQESELTLDFGTDGVDVGNVAGNVAFESEVSRSNAVYVQFQDGASIQIVEDNYPTSTSEFLYLAPSLPNASLIVAAAEGEGSGASYAMTHKRGIAAGTLDVELDLPFPPKQSKPAVAETEVTWDTEFSWSLPEPDNKVVVIHVEDSDYFQGLYIVTDRPTTHLPTFDSFELRKGGTHFWEVETHMACASMDECAGEEGFLDPLVSASSGIAKWDRDGSYATSGTRSFTVAE